MSGAVPTHAVLVAAPPERPFTRLVEVVQLLAREAIVADIADCSFDARLVLGSAHTRGVDEEATCLRVFAEALADPRPRKTPP